MKKLILLHIVFTSFYSISRGETFSSPVSNQNIACVFDATNCASPGNYHTGIDYWGIWNQDVYASASGSIVYIMPLSGNDHGMGNSVIIEHTLIGGGIVYSLYAHLASVESGLSIGNSVCKGEKIGEMGASGYQCTNYWCNVQCNSSGCTPHLHFEIKVGPVLHNPNGSGLYWGYTPSSANNYGYINPQNYFNNIGLNVNACDQLLLNSAIFTTPYPLCIGQQATPGAINITNTGTLTWSGDLSIAIHDTTGNFLMDLCGVVQNQTISAGSNLTIPFNLSSCVVNFTNIASGWYDIRLKYRTNGSSNWKLVTAHSNFSNPRNVEIDTCNACSPCNRPGSIYYDATSDKLKFCENGCWVDK